ncbi:RNA polymerase sigma-70 factor [Sphingobacterium sp. SGG-5]|uniref:RNA polymerase sigma factor n=1 Tax=Sphingobacterium sp. SGG-5 TaxID=2710881 RepID=UPI0013ECB1A1|nr:RNA polymerase sigma-70 factor [Sphingobacterium sp. SGG-5]NGM60890.1 RNA polymerase sigma-70 factor [Sphingobacterium sp. SGG-5]
MNNYGTYDDFALLALLKAGDEKSFAEIYDRYWAVLYRHAYKLLKDEVVAQDIVQEVFVNLWDKIHHLDLQNSLSSYLYAAVRNKVLNVIQREKYQKRYVDSMIHFMKTSEALTDHKLRANMLQEKIEKEVAFLPAKMRHIFEMSRIQHLSHKEIAQELKLSDKTVKKQINNAIRILRFKLSSFLLLIIWISLF